jgi:nitroreductase
MDIEEVMRTTFAVREFTDAPVPDQVLYRILDSARFAPSGGNRQGWRVIIVKNSETRKQLRQFMQPTVRRYLAQASAGEVPYNTIHPSQVEEAQIANTSVRFPLIDNLSSVPVVLVICVDLSVVTSFDKDLNRVGVISGASIYPFVWNILLAARNEGLGGVLTTFLAESENQVKDLLKLPDNFAIASLVPLGQPTKQLTRLKRAPVESFVRLDSWEGDEFRI